LEPGLAWAGPKTMGWRIFSSQKINSDQLPATRSAIVQKLTITHFCRADFTFCLHYS
jgi:hypothetical protein